MDEEEGWGRATEGKEKMWVAYCFLLLSWQLERGSPADRRAQLLSVLEVSSHNRDGRARVLLKVHRVQLHRTIETARRSLTVLNIAPLDTGGGAPTGSFCSRPVVSPVQVEETRRTAGLRLADLRPIAGSAGASDERRREGMSKRCECLLIIGGWGGAVHGGEENQALLGLRLDMTGHKVYKVKYKIQNNIYMYIYTIHNIYAYRNIIQC